MCLLDKIRKLARWSQEDDYPSCEEWREKDNKLLEFARQKGVLDCYQHRLQTDNKSRRDETINELRVAYFFEKGCGMPIVEWHPSGGRGDFIVSINEKNIFCEVKSPGWEGEIVKSQGSNSSRIRQPKYIHAETRSVDNSTHIMSTIERAYNKFLDNMPTLLIVVDDFWMDCFTDGLCIDRALHRPKLPQPYVDNKPEGVFVGRQYERLGGALFVQLDLISNKGFVWKVHIAKNNNAIFWVRLPDELVNAVESVRRIDEDFVEIYKINNGCLEKS